METVHFEHIALAAVAAGGVVFSGALYALCYALWRQRADARLLLCAAASYVVLLLATFVLQSQLGLSGVWIALMVCLLAGYLIAPVLIWRLSAATHVADTASTAREGSAHD